MQLRSYLGMVNEEQLEAIWSQGLQRLLHDFLLPFGGVRLGTTSRGLSLEITPVGRYILGLESDLVLDEARPEKQPARVQPDFEIVFVSPSAALEAAISRFAQRLSSGVGVLFRITRDSILGAAQAGLGADEVLGTLKNSTSTSIPTNVEHEIRGWFQSCRRLSLEPAQLLRCPDEATAARVLSAVGAGKLEQIAPTVLALIDPKQKAAVIRACRKSGLFVAASALPQRAAKKKRRYSRWD
jgi:hypothetical protein